MKKTLTLAFALALALAACNGGSEENATDYKTTNQKGMERVFNFIKACKTYYIATAEGAQPRVRPFGTVNVYDGKLYIQTGKKKRTAQQLAENPLAELCCFDGERWIGVSGKLIPDERVEAKKAMLDAYPELRGMYDENDDNTIVYYFQDATAYLSSFTAPEEEIKF